MSQKINAIILSNDSSFSYNFRSKLLELGMDVQYSGCFGGLLDFLLENDKGLVFVKTGSCRCQRYIKQYSLLQNDKNIVFIFINDNDSLNIDCDNIFTYECKQSDLCSKLPYIIRSMKNRIGCSSYISSSKIEQYISLLFKSLKFPYNINGYDYLKDCICIMMDHKNNCSTLKDSYNIIAQKHNKFPANIEKSIRLAIGNFIKQSSIMVKCIFGKDTVTNNEFVSYMINTIRQLYSYSIKSC